MKRFTLISCLLALTLTGAGHTSCTSRSAATPADTSCIKTLKDHGISVTWIQDNHKPKTMPASLFPEAARSVIDSLGMTESGIPATISTFLVQADGKNLLFDAGLGAPDSRLLPALQSLQLSPDDIQYIFLTHFHGDHIGGLLTPSGEAVFKKAQVYASKAEYDGWMKMPKAQRAQVEQLRAAYGNRLHLFGYTDALPENIKPMEAKGHTPGHTVYAIGRFLIVGDLMHGAALQMPHPEFCASYDQQPDQAVSTRRYFLDYVRSHHLIMAGMHLPAPAFWQP